MRRTGTLDPYLLLAGSILDLDPAEALQLVEEDEDGKPFVDFFSPHFRQLARERLADKETEQ